MGKIGDDMDWKEFGVLHVKRKVRCWRRHGRPWRTVSGFLWAGSAQLNQLKRCLLSLSSHAGAVTAGKCGASVPRTALRLIRASAHEEPNSDDRMGTNYGNKHAYITRYLWSDANGLSLSNLNMRWERTEPPSCSSHQAI